jgi:hypothetical protein
MGRGQRIRKNRYPRRLDEDKIAVLFQGIPLVALIVLTLVVQAAAGPEVTLRDLWDSPHTLEGICRDQAAILFVCDTGLSVCREGAVFFDTRADKIESRGFRAILVFVGDAPGIRDFVLRANISLPVYIDPDGRVYENLLEEEVLPALVLVDGKGRHVKTMYGGGESLEGNIGVLLEESTGKGRRWWLIAIPAAIAAAAILALSLN